MLFQFLSDIHLEKMKGYIPDVKKIADVLLLAGDIGSPYFPSYREFLYRCSHQFSKVFVVSGNHEFWNSTLYDTHGTIGSIVSTMKNVEYLNNSVRVYKEKTIFGATFWTKVNDELKYQNNDNKFIKGFNYQIRNQLHYETYNLIKNIRPDILLTHYPPVKNVFHPKYSNYRLDLFVNDYPELLNKCQGWVCGHLHHYVSYPNVYMNPYHFEKRRV